MPDTTYQVGGARLLAGRLGDSATQMLEIGLMNNASVAPGDRVRQESRTAEGHLDEVLDYGGSWLISGQLHSVDAEAVAAVTDYALVDAQGNLLFSDETTVVDPFSVIVVPDKVVATAGDSPLPWYFAKVHTNNLGAFVHAIADADAPVDFELMSKRANEDFGDTPMPKGTRFGFRGRPGSLGLTDGWALPAGYGAYTPAP